MAGKKWERERQEDKGEKQMGIRRRGETEEKPKGR